jgi:hypothetical protein
MHPSNEEARRNNLTNLPKALQRQLEEAEALEKALTQSEEPETPEVQDQQTEVVASEPEEPQAEPTPEAHQPEEPKPLTAKPGKENDADYWRSRATSMHGIAQAQAQELHELRNQVSALTTEIKNLQVKPEAPQQADPLVTDKDVETFGSDLIDLQERVAKKALAEARTELKGIIDQQAEYIKQLEAKVGVVNQQVSANAQDRFYNDLAKQVPDWEQINGDQRFLEWLGETDQMSGVSRQAYLDDAANRMDLARVAAIFNAFKQTVVPATQPVNQSRKSELERQVAPSKSKAAAPTETGKRIWTKAEFERAMDPRYTKHMSADEAAKLETELDLAVAEGRVQF